MGKTKLNRWLGRAEGRPFYLNTDTDNKIRFKKKEKGLRPHERNFGTPTWGDPWQSWPNIFDLMWTSCCLAMEATRVSLLPLSPRSPGTFRMRATCPYTFEHG